MKCNLVILWVFKCLSYRATPGSDLSLQATGYFVLDMELNWNLVIAIPAFVRSTSTIVMRGTTLTLQIAELKIIRRTRSKCGELSC